MCAQSLQSCPTLPDPMDCSLPDSPVDGILQARVRKYNKLNYPENKVGEKKKKTDVQNTSAKFFTVRFNRWEISKKSFSKCLLLLYVLI